MKRPNRFIPACAGNRPQIHPNTMLPPVHPRVCGEQAGISPCSECVVGSSPRVRGTACDTGRCARPSRFIPACAGNRPDADASEPSRPVHPRVCGEQLNQPVAHLRLPGSSPRVRGTVISSDPSIGRRRFIPACAGNSSRCSPRTRLGSVHPRVCGEQGATTGNAAFPNGSSPRVRGTGRWKSMFRSTQRFIPACAGNSHNGHCKPLSTPVHPRVCGEQIPSPST